MSHMLQTSYTLPVYWYLHHLSIIDLSAEFEWQVIWANQIAPLRHTLDTDKHPPFC